MNDLMTEIRTEDGVYVPANPEALVLEDDIFVLEQEIFTEGEGE